MIDTQLFVNGEKVHLHTFINLYNKAKKSGDIEQFASILPSIISGLTKCQSDDATRISQLLIPILNGIDQNHEHGLDQHAFDGLHDAGYISDEDYAKLEPKSNFVPRCPVCGSPDLKTISGLHRAASFSAFGFASSTARAQRQCRNCGYKF